MPPELLVSGVGITILVPALVELAKRSGLPTQYAGIASIVAAGLVWGWSSCNRTPNSGAPPAGGSSPWSTASPPPASTARCAS
jgi:hypothetical protein